MIVIVVVKVKRQERNCSAKAPGYFTLIGDKAPPATRDSSEVVHVLNQHCYPPAGNDGRMMQCMRRGLTTMRTVVVDELPLSMPNQLPSVVPDECT